VLVLLDAPARHAAPSQAPRAAARLRSATTIVAGAAGLLCLLVLLAPAVGFRLVVIASGSMRPALPPGAIVLSRSTPADDIRVGDVVTVARPGQLDVTHRVVSIGAQSDLLGTVDLVLQGDANASPDPQPYTVTSAGVTVASIPTGGQVILLMRHPVTIAVLSVFIALLVLWTWWPTTERRP
jgi:signal peptidase